ncbi:MAG: tetratricopeptide repeat protein [Calothrix sp. MO_167.B12]|nr:tetratricopeptide repeat protein [Calothrix sp. MO_167.B12]
MSRNFTSCLVQLSIYSGLDLNAYLVLNQKPTRQNQKLKTLKKYIEQYNSGWKKRLELANLLYEMGRWSEAIPEYYQVIKAQSQLIQPHIQLGKILHLLNRKGEAIAVYKSALVLSKNEATKQHIIGSIESCRGNTKAAIAAFKSATALEPNNLAHWIAWGKIQIEAEDFAAALSSFETVLSLDPHNFMGLNYCHDLLLALGNISAAERCLNKAVTIASTDVQTQKRLITNRLRKRLVFDAEGKQTKKLIGSLLKRASGSAEIHNLLAQYYILRGEKQKGIEVSKKFTQEHFHNPHAWYYYSQYLFELGKHEIAAKAILQAYELSVGKLRDREIYRALCKILPATGRLEQTRSIITEMLKYFPESWTVWSTTGKILVQYLQECDRGCYYSLQATKLQPKLADPWLRHGRILSLAGKYEKAIAALIQGWQFLCPETQNLKSVSAAVWLGESYQALGDNLSSQEWLETACQQIQELIKFNPATANYWYDRALGTSRRFP